tara:strand:- start:32 stop:1315 length:1284 start_codon:yes stop_codon:yes gene_type:complete
MKIKKIILPILLSSSFFTHAHKNVTFDQVAEHYVQLGHVMYQDSYLAAKSLQTAIDELIKNPTQSTLDAAKEAWITSRIPYQKTEVFRFANDFVDNWQGKVNTWPIDQGFIDYVNPDKYYQATPAALFNLVAKNKIRWLGKKYDLKNISPDVIRMLHTSGSFPNVTTGYHAIEFLLWGQDLHGIEEGAGERPYTDYAYGKSCTHKHCDNRRNFLQIVTHLLVQDLKEMTDYWDPNIEGSYAQKFQKMDSQKVVYKMFHGLSEFSTLELSTMRINSAVEFNHPEEEHDCFSDNTHWSYFNNVMGMKTFYTGDYERIDGTLIEGPGLIDLVKSKDPKHARKMRKAMRKVERNMQIVVDKAEIEHVYFDQMIGTPNTPEIKHLKKTSESLRELRHYNSQAVFAVDLELDDATTRKLEVYKSPYHPLPTQR